MKEWRSENKERIAEWQKEHRKTGREVIRQWRKRGVIHNDFNELYETFTEASNCYLCDREFGNNTKNRKCLDHHHLSGYPRFICCNGCNLRLAGVDNKVKDVLLEMHRYFINNSEKFYH